MSDQKQTPITREWLESKGFRDNGFCLIKATSNLVEFIEYRQNDIWWIQDGGGNWINDPTQERLSALWFALTGEEL